jgi:glycerate 2-kinase
MDKDTKEVLGQIYRAAVAAVDPYISVKENLSLQAGALVIGGVRYPLADINNIYVIGAGKAAYGMARAAEEVLGVLIKDGAVVTKDGHGGPLKHIRLYEASHPVPDGRGVQAAGKILDIAKGAGSDDLVLCLLSGGASALMVLPAEGITLTDKQETTRLLLASGADIGEINCVRKHLSGIKGGRLAQAAHPARVSSLIISDVIGNDLSVIASGPTAPDSTTYLQAVEILRIRGIYDRLPPAVGALLEKGAGGLLPETPKPGDAVFERVENLPVAFNMAALGKAAEVAGYLGYNAAVLDSELHGEARDAGARLAFQAMEYREKGGATPACLLVGGETTVTVTGDGLGGRNQELALAFSLYIQGEDVRALFAGTDGTDGPTGAAGAFVDGETVYRAEELRLRPASFLTANNSYRFFESLGDLFITGPTGTNVMDIGIILVG